MTDLHSLKADFISFAPLLGRDIAPLSISEYFSGESAKIMFFGFSDFTSSEQSESTWQKNYIISVVAGRKEARKLKVCIIQESSLEETLVICEVSALLKRNGAETCLLIDKLEKALLSEIERIDPDVISIQAEILGEKWAKETLEKVREKFPSKDIIVFGSLPTFYPEKMGEYSDGTQNLDGEQNSEKHHIIKGEPEREFLKTIQKIKIKKIKIERKERERGKKEGKAPETKKQKISSGEVGQDKGNHPGMDWHIYYKRYKVLRDFPVKRFIVSRGCLLIYSSYHISVMKKKKKDSSPLDSTIMKHIA